MWQKGETMTLKEKTDLTGFDGLVVWHEPEGGIHMALCAKGYVRMTRYAEINYQKRYQDADFSWSVSRPFHANGLNFPMATLAMEAADVGAAIQLLTKHPTMQLFVTRPVEGKTIESWDYFGGMGTQTAESLETVALRRDKEDEKEGKCEVCGDGLMGDPHEPEHTELCYTCYQERYNDYEEEEA